MTRKTIPIAHVSGDLSRIHLLEEHLTGTADLAASFASRFDAAGWARLAGIWHDLGKYAFEFQSMIRSATGFDAEAHIETKVTKVDHSTSGSIHALRRIGPVGRALAYVIAGHHAGLPDWQGEAAGSGNLATRLTRIQRLESALRGEIPEEILGGSIPAERPAPGNELSASIWIRMLFSCLVDADFLDTERFMDLEKFDIRSKYPALSQLLVAFDSFMRNKLEKAPDTPVNRIRRQILERCESFAVQPPGAFSLTVPTGGGKTLSSMAFALRHAMTHQKARRIIYVIPFTSIIEQTADQFRDIFGDAVIEHHSNIDPTDETRESAKTRLACENWDAPIIVTTSVQFFESLFSSRSSRCRKLHNIVDSVVIIDEAQQLPPEFLTPILESLDELRKNYGVSLVFCTATQPALAPRETTDFRFKGIAGVTEIMESPIELHKRLKRVEITVPENLTMVSEWQEIADRVSMHETVLCIVGRRDDARMLWSLLPEGTFHLSALMCGSHRSDKIREIRKRLKDGLPTRVVSTQLVEAGVDLDFPVVFRALAGLDSIAQAAGRCNREGLLPIGKVHVFVPPTDPPVGQLRQAAEITRRLLSTNHEDPMRPERFNEYFREFYWIQGDRLDARGIMADLRNDSGLRFGFRSAASRFRLIDDKYAPIIVRYRNDEERNLLDRVGPERLLMRRLQRQIVNVPSRVHLALLDAGAILESYPGIFVQSHPNFYDEVLGFKPDASIVYGPDGLIL